MSTESKLAIERLRMREELKSIPEEELSDVIEQEARKRVETHSSTPAPAKNVAAILNAVNSIPRLIALVVIIAAATYLLSRGVPWPK